ncbi:SE2200 family small protein [Staphylococcus saprophyticus]
MIILKDCEKNEKTISSFSNRRYRFCALKRYQKHVNKAPNIEY